MVQKVKDLSKTGPRNQSFQNHSSGPRKAHNLRNQQIMSAFGARDGNEAGIPTIIDEESFINAEEEDWTTTFAPRRTSPGLVRPTPESQPPRTPSFFIRSPPMTMPRTLERSSPINASTMSTFKYDTMSTPLKEALHSIGVTWASEHLFCVYAGKEGFQGD